MHPPVWQITACHSQVLLELKSLWNGAKDPGTQGEVELGQITGEVTPGL